MVKFLDENELLVSRTDLHGIITYGNRVFSEACEFDDSLMIGFNHNIIRHPDMPAWAFEELWYMLDRDQEWTGIVKNSTFNGLKCYWVKCNIKPLYNDRGKKVGYESVRRQATDLEIESAMQLYGIDLE